MALDLNRGFEVGGNKGLSFTDGVSIASGSASPVGEAAPVGTHYIQTNGDTWKKYGTGNNDWINLSKRQHKIIVHKVNDNSLSGDEFLLTFPGTTVSASYSGYGSCRPFLIPFNCTLKSMQLVLKGGNYENRSTAGDLYFQTAFYNHTYNGATEILQTTWTLEGSHTGYTLSNGTYHWNTSDFSIDNGTNSFLEGNLIGVEWLADDPFAGKFYRIRRPYVVLTLEEI